jgi:lipoyl-dependent peroxiredoxin
MATSNAKASWEGTLKNGRGTMKPEHAADVPFSFGTRFEGAQGANPEELIGAALAGCFSMALSSNLEKAAITPLSIHTTARVHLETGTITRIDLSTEARMTGGDEATLRSVVETTKKGCPVGKLLSAAQITVDAKLAR